MAWRISLRELEVFLAVVDHGSVTAAAVQIDMSQSAASQALIALEQGLSAKLFDRVGKRMLINENGRLLLPKARATLANARDLQQLFKTDTGIHLHIGASTTIGNYVLPGLLARFQRHYPRASINLVVGNTADIVEAVATFKVDLGFIEGQCHQETLKVHTWQKDRLCLFAAPQHPLAGMQPSRQQLQRQQWVLRESGSGTREELERLLLPHLGHVDKVMELGQSEAIKHMVAAGMGISCLSEYVVSDWLAQGRLVELKAWFGELYRDFFVIRHPQKDLGKGLALLGQILQYELHQD